MDNKMLLRKLKSTVCRKSYYADSTRLNDKRFGVQPFFQRAGGVQRQRLWSSIAMDEISYA